MNYRSFCTAILLFFAAGMAMFGQAKPGDAAKGKDVFMKNGCYQCHGTVGQGGLAGPRLAQTKLTLSGFTTYVRNPAPGNMPPFREKVMSDQELADVFAYVQSVPLPVPWITFRYWETELALFRDFELPFLEFPAGLLLA